MWQFTKKPHTFTTGAGTANLIAEKQKPNFLSTVFNWHSNYWNFALKNSGDSDGNVVS